MKKYKVTLWLMIPDQEYSEKPKTRRVVFEVEAKNSHLAYKEAEKLDTSYLSIWDYKVEILNVTE